MDDIPVQKKLLHIQACKLTKKNLIYYQLKINLDVQ